MSNGTLDRTTSKNIRLYGQANSAEASRLREFLGRHVVQYEWVELNSDQDCQKYLKLPNLKNVRLPVVELPNGQMLFAPTEKEIGECLGWVTKPRFKEYDLAIYGAGPAGLSASVYAAFDGLNVIVVERKAVGGQAGSSPLIENYLGFPDGISGAELAERARQQAVKLGVELCLLSEGVAIEFKDNLGYGLLADGTKVAARANLCACGVEYRHLDLANEDRFINAGVFYGAGASESPYCRNEHVFVVGGGNGAGQAALNFAKYAAKVTMIIRGSNLSATLSRHLIDLITTTNNIELLFNHQVTKLDGEDWLRQIQITNLLDGSVKIFDTRHLFVCIGGVPHTDYFKNTNVICDELEYVVTGPDLIKDGKLPDVWPLQRQPYFLEGSVPGLFAAGDVRHGSIKRFASAAGEGAMAVAFIERYLSETFENG